MAPDDEDPNKSRRPPPPADENIFEALHRHATEHISTMLQNTIGVPSSVTRHRSGRWPDDLTPSTSSQPQSTSESSSSPSPPANPADRPRNARDEADVVDRIFEHLAGVGRDAQGHMKQWGWGFGWPPGQNQNGSWSFSLRDEAQWDFFTYLTQSAYSPLCLDDDRDLARSALAGRWPEAFEQLLQAETGEALDHEGSRADRNQGVSRQEECRWRSRNGGMGFSNFNTMPWLARCVQLEQKRREALPPPEATVEGLRQPWVTADTPFYRGVHMGLGMGPWNHSGFGRPFEPSGRYGPWGLPPPPKDEQIDEFIEEMKKMDEDGPDSELDVYERFQSQSPPSPRQIAASEAMAELDKSQPAPELATKSAEVDNQSTPRASASKPEVLSTLTTTERTILPDGSVSTKVVLRKRFADGREESTETIHTGRVDQPSQEASAGEKKPDGSESKKGWFWS